MPSSFQIIIQTIWQGEASPLAGWPHRSFSWRGQPGDQEVSHQVQAQAVLTNIQIICWNFSLFFFLSFSMFLPIDVCIGNSLYSFLLLLHFLSQHFVRVAQVAQLQWSYGLWRFLLGTGTVPYGVAEPAFLSGVGADIWKRLRHRPKKVKMRILIESFKLIFNQSRGRFITNLNKYSKWTFSSGAVVGLKFGAESPEPT